MEVKEALKQLCLTGDPDALSTILLNLEEDDDHAYVEPKCELVSNISGQQKCPQCGKMIVGTGNMKQHITAYCYVCPQCDQICKTKSNLEWHTRAKHEESKPSCETLNR